MFLVIMLVNVLIVFGNQLKTIMKDVTTLQGWEHLALNSTAFSQSSKIVAKFPQSKLLVKCFGDVNQL